MKKEERIDLLQLVVQDLEQVNDKYCGICYRIDCLYLRGIPTKDIAEFKKWFKTQKPHSKFHAKFANHFTFMGGDFWWCRTNKGLEQRILFLKHLIEKQSK